MHRVAWPTPDVTAFSCQARWIQQHNHQRSRVVIASAALQIRQLLFPYSVRATGESDKQRVVCCFRPFAWHLYVAAGSQGRCPRPHAALTRDGGSWRSSNDLHPANASSLAAGHSRASTRSCRTTIALRPQIHTVRLTALDRDLSWLHDMEFTVRHHHRRLLSLQTIPVVSITGGLPATALPLSLVLIFDGIVSIVAITAPSVLCASPA